MSYEPYYPGGWQSGESGGTPITPEALNHMENGIKNSLPAIESTDYPGCYYRTVNGVTEWINPPMDLGVVRRTTERIEGKVVFAVRINIGALPSKTESVAALGLLIDDNCEIVDAQFAVTYKAQNSEYINPYVLPGGTLYHGLYWNAVQYFYRVHTNFDASGYTGIVTVKFIKR